VCCQHVVAIRVAALYDIHANVPPLDAVLADLERAGVDRIVVGGDVVPGPLPVETIERLRALGDRAAQEPIASPRAPPSRPRQEQAPARPV